LARTQRNLVSAGLYANRLRLVITRKAPFSGQGEAFGYLPNDTLALMWDGTKRWPDKRRLERFGMQRCQLTAQGAKTIISEVAEAVNSAAKELNSVAQHDPLAAETIERMRAAWVDGVASLRK